MVKICLTGATGGLGSRVLHHLLYTLKVPASDLIISTSSDTATASSRLPKDVDLEIRYGDFSSPESLESAFSGAEKLLLVSFPSMKYEERVEKHKSAIDAARKVGVKHIYYSSLAFAGDSKAFVMQAHIDTEAYLKQVSQGSGGAFQYTIIREGLYAESYPLYLGLFDPSAGDRIVKIPNDGGPGASWVTRDDLGEGTARIMMNQPVTNSRFDFTNAIVTLTGSEALTLDELASLLSKHLGWGESPLKVEKVGKEAYVAYQLGRQQSQYRRNAVDQDFFEGWATTYPAMQQGETAVVDPLLEQLLGRQSKGMDGFFREYLSNKDAQKDEKYSRPH